MQIIYYHLQDNAIKLWTSKQRILKTIVRNFSRKEKTITSSR